MVWKIGQLTLKYNYQKMNNTAIVTTLKYLRFRIKSQVEDLEENIVKICKDSDINISSMDIEGCHRLPLGRNSTNTTEQVIVKFVNRKHSEAMLQRKKDINSKNKVFVTHSLCPYCRFQWGKCKRLQRKGRISQVFYIGVLVTIRFNGNSPAIKILHERDVMVYQERLPGSH